MSPLTDRDALYLGHIRTAIADIRNFTAEGAAHFKVDRKTQSAVIRQLEIIGEAVKNLSATLTASEPDVPWRLIAGTRDRLIHAYFSVSLDAVWSMVKQDLPPLSGNVNRILGTTDDAFGEDHEHG